MISDEAVEAAARGIKAAQCFGREGPFGRYDYTSYGWEKPHRVRDFRDPRSETWGADVYKSDDAVACELEYERLTEQHIARAALEAALPHLLASQGCGTGHSADAGTLPALAWESIETARPVDGRSILVKTGDCPPIVGEAWWREENGKLDLWWANTSPGDYYSDPISQSNNPVTHWMPLPPADGGEAVHSPGEREGSREANQNTPARPQKWGEG